MAATLRVLNVDDNDAARYLRSRGLMRSGFEVIEAASGGEALEMAQGAAIDVAVLDVKLPDMSGLEVTQRLKADPMTSAVRIVQVSSVYLDAGTELESLRHGADIFLRLPVEDAALSTVVTTLAGMRAAQAARFPNFLSHAAVNEGCIVGIAHLDLAGYFNQVNGRFCEITGRAPQQLCHLGLGEVFHPHDAERATDMFLEMARGEGRDFRTQLRVAAPGRSVLAHCSFSLMRSASGVAREAVLAMVDISGPEPLGRD